MDGRVRTLWHAEIDQRDMEFVTTPFTNQEKDDLKLCIKTIELALDSLADLYQDSQSITFRMWNCHLAKKIQDTGLSQCEVVWKYTGPADCIGTLDLSYFIEQDNRVALFQPHVTLQHHLSSTIRLELALCAESDGISEDLPTQYKFHWEDSVSNRAKRAKEVLNILFSDQAGENEFRLPKKTSAREGFMFLHLLTWLNLTFNPLGARAQIIEIHSLAHPVDEPHGMTGQVNAKRDLTILSRRPFSDMWREIILQKGFCDGERYRDCFNRLILPPAQENLRTRSTFLNYGHKYRDENGALRDLSPLASTGHEALANTLFSHVSYRETAEEESRRLMLPGALQEYGVESEFEDLLKKGILSTSMVRSVPLVCTREGRPMADIFANYFDNIIDSIDNPQQRYEIEDSNWTLRSAEYEYDLLSPPHFLPLTDSMGWYRGDRATYLPEYGEAILEFRTIKEIGGYAREQMEIDRPTNGFLGSHRSGSGSTSVLILCEHVEKLIYFLETILGDEQ